MVPEALEVQVRANRAMSVVEKLRVAESLRKFAWELKKSSVKRHYPELSEDELHQRVLKAFANGGT